jgi:hypothetical protein
MRVFRKLGVDCDGTSFGEHLHWVVTSRRGAGTSSASKDTPG